MRRRPCWWIVIRWKQPRICTRTDSSLPRTKETSAALNIALRLFPRCSLGLASISLRLLGFNASEPDGRSRFRRFVVYGRTRTSEQEFITWHQKLHPGTSSSRARAPWYPTLWRPFCQLIQRSVAGSPCDTTLMENVMKRQSYSYWGPSSLWAAAPCPPWRRSLHHCQCLWYEQNRLADLCNWDAARKLHSYQM